MQKPGHVDRDGTTGVPGQGAGRRGRSGAEGRCGRAERRDGSVSGREIGKEGGERGPLSARKRTEEGMSGALFRRLQTVWADVMPLFKQISGVSDSRAWSSSAT